MIQFKGLAGNLSTVSCLSYAFFQESPNRSYRDFSESYFRSFAVSIFHVSPLGKIKKSARPIAARLCGYKENPRNKLSQQTVHIA